MSDIFISYSRKDRDFMRKIFDKLESQEKNVWVDWEDIPPTAEWLKEIFDSIESTDTFLFVISPESIVSDTCIAELKHAQSNNKRIIPILYREVNTINSPEEINKIQWIFFRDNDNFGKSMKTLESAIDIDLDWVKAHTRLLVRSKEWDSKKRDGSYILSGTDLDDAQKWLIASDDHNTKPTPLQVAYITASQQGAVAQQRKQLRGFYIVSIVYAVFQSIISYFIVFDEISETGLVFLSPVWLLGLIFGVAGLTIGRNSLKKSVIATIIAGLLLFVFFNTIWHSL